MSKTPELKQAAAAPSAPAAAPTPPPAAPAAAVFTRREGIDSNNIEFDTPSEPVRHDLVQTTGIALADAAGILEDPNTLKVKAALAQEKFMAEVLEIQLADPGDENEHQFAEITVNGERVCVRRGDTAFMKRCHVAVLAAAKIQRVVQKKVTAPDGSMGYEETYVLRPVYPFQVMQDPSGKVGNTWLRAILQRS